MEGITIENLEPQKKELYDALINDLHSFFWKFKPEETKAAKEKEDEYLKQQLILNNNINDPTEIQKIIKENENKEFYKAGVLDRIFTIIEKNKDIQNSPLFKFCRSILNSIISLKKGDSDPISSKNIQTLILVGYCFLNCISYLFQEEKTEGTYRNSFDPSKYENLNNFILNTKEYNAYKSIYNTFVNSFKSSNKKIAKTLDDSQVYNIFLTNIKKTDFKKNYEDY